MGTGWTVFLTCPSPVLGVLSIRPTPALLQLLHPVFHVPFSSCEGPGQSCRRRSFSSLSRPGVRFGHTWHGKAGCSGCSSGSRGGWCAHSDTALELGARTFWLQDLKNKRKQKKKREEKERKEKKTHKKHSSVPARAEKNRYKP